MRIIRLKLQNETRARLQALRKLYAIEDLGYLEDLYSLLRSKGHGMPSRDKLDQLAKKTAKAYNIAPSSISLTMRARAHQLTEVVKSSLFQSAAKSGDKPLDALSRLLALSTMISRKVREAQCASCEFYAACEFGKTYSKSTTDIRTVRDNNYKSKVHKDCPYLPDLDGMAMVAEATRMMAAMTKPSSPMQAAGAQSSANYYSEKFDPAQLDRLFELESKFKTEQHQEDNAELNEDAGVEELDEKAFLSMFAAYNELSKAGQLICGKHEPNYGDHTTAAKFLTLAEKVVKDLSQEQLAIYMLGMTLKTELQRQGKYKRKASDVPEDQSTTDNMRSVSEITKVQASQHGLPAEVFEAKVARKALNVDRYSKKEARPQALYVLLDTSGSMSCPFGTLFNNQTVFTRNSLSIALCLALAERQKTEQGAMLMRAFESGPGPLFTASNPAHFEAYAAYLRNAAGSGGGTSILIALRQAFDDLESKVHVIRPEEILLITDGEDPTMDTDKAIDLVLQRKKELKVQLSALIVGSAVRQVPKGLQKVSERTYHAKNGALSPKDLIGVIK